MPEYIERDKFLEAVGERSRNSCDGRLTYQQLKEMVENFSTVQVTEKPQWISVEDKLPDVNEDVLLYFDGCPNLVVGGLYFGTGWYANATGDDYTDCYNPDTDAGKIQPPTHWMPLPEPPDRTEEELP